MLPQLLQNPLQQLGGPGAVPTYNMPAFTAQQYQQSPGYAAALQGGQQALQNTGATTTGALSGNTLKALQGFGTGLANQDYQQAYSNYATNYQNQFNANNSNFWNTYNALNQGNTNTFNWLNTLSGNGQNAALGLGALGNAATGNIGNALIGAGNAAAAGAIGTGNAISGGLGSIATILGSPTSGYNSSILAQILGGGSSAGYDAAGGGA